MTAAAAVQLASQTWALERDALDAIVYEILRDEVTGSHARAALDRGRQQDMRPGAIAQIGVGGLLTQREDFLSMLFGGTATTSLAAALRSALVDPKVSAIVFDINSPGGTVAGTGELASEILASRGVKPIVAQVNSLAASGAYWLASAADEIVVTPGGEGGSIGVYRIHEDIRGLLEKRGVKPTIIRAQQSPHKIADSGLEPLSADAQAHLQARVDQAMERMVRSIARGRGTAAPIVRDRFGGGRVFGAEELVSRGMADRIDTLEGTLERLGAGSFNPVAARATAAREMADLRSGLRGLSQTLSRISNVRR